MPHEDDMQRDLSPHAAHSSIDRMVASVRCNIRREKDSIPNMFLVLYLC